MDESNDITRREALRHTGVLLGGVAAAPTLAGVLSGCGEQEARSAPHAELARGPSSKHFVDRFEDMPIIDGLESDLWGAKYVLPRDADNGIEAPDKAFWGGSVLKDPEGTYHMYVATWDEAYGHWRDGKSQLARATADDPMGPFTLQEEIGDPRGHNPEAIAVDGKIGIFNNGAFELAYSDSYDGPWTLTDLDFEGREDGMSNTGSVVRDDGSILVLNRSPAQIHVADSLLGPYRLVKEWEHPSPFANVEDTEIWREDGLYHLVANQWSRRTGFYMFSEDGIDWTVADNYQAWVPGITRYEDGTNTLWYKMERIKILTQNGRATHAYFGVADNTKFLNYGNDKHNDKTLVVPLASLGEGTPDGPLSAGSYRIKNVASDLVMTVNGGMNEEGAPVVQRPWREESGEAPYGHPYEENEPEDWETNWDQRFIASTVRQGVYRLEVQGTKRTKPQKMLAVKGDATSDDAPLVQATYDDESDRHHWRIRENDDGTHRIENAMTGKAATVKGGSTDADAALVQRAWDGSNAQKWVIETPLSFSTAPAAPSSLSMADPSGASVELQWQTSSPGESGIEPYYIVYVDGAKDHEVEAGTTSTTVSGLSGGTHEIVVTAADNPYNESSPSNRITVTR